MKKPLYQAHTRPPSAQVNLHVSPSLLAEAERVSALKARFEEGDDEATLAPERVELLNAELELDETLNPSELLRLDAQAGAHAELLQGEALLSGHETSPSLLSLSHHEGSVPQRAVESLPALASHRYQAQALIGRGGMGEVWRVYDTTLERTVALKRLREPLAVRGDMVALFTREARLTARLQHPAVISVHDFGLDEEGRLCFLMDEVEGLTCAEAFERLHATSTSTRWAEEELEWGFRRLIDALYRVAEAVAYAHSRGVTHRDLKPDNLTLGQHGQVWVIDWGLAALTSDLSTQVGGTPRYMPPEQLTQSAAARAPSVDVYALGALLFELLSGCAPFKNERVTTVMTRLRRGERPQLEEHVTHTRQLPPPLVELVKACMATQPSERPSASEVARRLRGWLDGAQHRARAQKLVEQAQALEVKAEALKARAQALEAEAQEGLKGLPKIASAQEKAPWWSRQEVAHRCDVEGARRDADRLAHLQSALIEDPQCVEALQHLSARALIQHRRAERGRDEPQARAIADELTRLTARLPLGDSTREVVTHYLTGLSLLSLTLPSAASVRVDRYEQRQKRLTPQWVTTLERVSELELELPIGAYLLTIEAEGCEPVRYPVLLQRGCAWDERGPSAKVTPLPLPRLGELKPWERYVPRGWCDVGGDPEAPYGLPERPVWVEGFIISETPVTHEQYLDFLNHLCAEGRAEEALTWAPREQAKEGTLGELTYRFEGGRFEHPEGAEKARYPATQMTWHAARAYTTWLSAQEGHAYRLPLELEWEKAARGVDRRCFPWGDHFDPSYCVMMDSHQGAPLIHPADSNPFDESPYGVRSCAGNIREWCLDLFDPEGYRLDALGISARLPTEDELNDSGFRACRGGSFGNAASRARSADRDWWFPHLSYLARGFRVVRGFS